MEPKDCIEVGMVFSHNDNNGHLVFNCDKWANGQDIEWRTVSSGGYPLCFLKSPKGETLVFTLEEQEKLMREATSATEAAWRNKRNAKIREKLSD